MSLTLGIFGNERAAQEPKDDPSSDLSLPPQGRPKEHKGKSFKQIDWSLEKSKQKIT